MVSALVDLIDWSATHYWERITDKNDLDRGGCFPADSSLVDVLSHPLAKVDQTD